MDVKKKKNEKIGVFKFFGLQIDSKVKMKNIEFIIPLGLTLLGRQKYIQ